MMINLQQIQHLGDGDTAFLRDLLAVFLQETPDLVEQLETAVQNQDWNQAGRSIHQLKSNFALFGLEPLTTLSRQLEAEVKSRQLRLEQVQNLSKQTAAVLEALKNYLDSL